MSWGLQPEQGGSRLCSVAPDTAPQGSLTPTTHTEGGRDRWDPFPPPYKTGKEEALGIPSRLSGLGRRTPGPRWSRRGGSPVSWVRTSCALPAHGQGPSPPWISSLLPPQPRPGPPHKPVSLLAPPQPLSVLGMRRAVRPPPGHGSQGPRPLALVSRAATNHAPTPPHPPLTAATLLQPAQTLLKVELEWGAQNHSFLPGASLDAGWPTAKAHSWGFGHSSVTPIPANNRDARLSYSPTPGTDPLGGGQWTLRHQLAEQ